MHIRDLVISSLNILRTNRMRSFLTILGIVIGVMTIIAILALVQGLNASVEEQIQSLGSNTIFVQRFSWSAGRMDFQEIMKRKEIVLDDAWAIARLPLVDKIAPQKDYEIASLNYQGKTAKQVDVIGSTPDLQYTTNYTVESGRFINQDDYNHKQMVAAIGGYVVDNLFPNEDPVGKYLNIHGRRTLVIGVLGRKGSFFGQSQDAIIIMPLTSLRKYFLNLLVCRRSFVA